MGKEKAGRVKEAVAQEAIHSPFPPGLASVSCVYEVCEYPLMNSVLVPLAQDANVVVLRALQFNQSCACSDPCRSRIAFKLSEDQRPIL